MSTQHVRTSDGLDLPVSDTQGAGTGAADGPPLVLLHGWGFSRRFFDEVTPALAEHFRVLAPDLRGHGDSPPVPHSVRVARLGADLDALLTQLDLRGATVLGWSLGCAAVWSRLELFGSDRIARAVFCSQVPRQYLGPDWPWHHAQCYDDAGLAAFTTRLQLDLAAVLAEQTEEITATGLDPELREQWSDWMSRCPVQVRTALMSDHTRHDWRDFLTTLDLPVLVMAGQQDRAYDWRGVAWIGQHVPGAETVLFPDSAHALFHDEPDRFVGALVDFAARR